MYKNTKIKITIILLLFIELISVFLTFKSFSNKDINEIKITNEVNKNNFAIMIEQEDGSYLESDSNFWPSGNYRFDSEKSKCIDSKGVTLNDVLTFDFESNEAILASKKTTFCYLYFSIPVPDLIVNIDNFNVIKNEKYVKSIDCAGKGNAIYNTKYKRFQFENIISPAECTINYEESTDVYPTLRNVVETVNASQNYNEHGYRYSGQNPNNYVWFNDELWRIIGSIPTKIDSSGNVENLVKIIKEDIMTKLPFHNGNGNWISTWGNNTLYFILNSYYYGKGNATNNTYCNVSLSRLIFNCNYSYEGISRTGYYGKMIKNVYWNTGKSTDAVTASTAYTNEIKTQTQQGYVGLMASSDYGYAAGNLSRTMDKYDTYTITNSNWLNGKGVEWTIVPDAEDSTRVLYVNFDGNMDLKNVGFSFTVRPVVYLDSSVYVLNANDDNVGSATNPYQIAM